MRITAAEKAVTRKRILDTAKQLFRSKGFDEATTRDIAQAVGIANGTMFNYFSSKEAIVVELAHAALEKATREHDRAPSARSLEEDLFSLIAIQLRKLRSMRKYCRPLLDTVLAPATSAVSPTATEMRNELAEQLAQILARHGVDDPSPVQLSILWSLYTGVLAFWSHDASPKQEDSLALLDQSTRMFAHYLTT